jgi:hypothetical protein
MKHVTRILCLFLFAFTFTASTASAQSWNQDRNGFPGGRRNSDPANRGANIEERLLEQGISLPADWETMTQEERGAFTQEHGLRGRGSRDGSRRGNIDPERQGRGAEARMYTRNARKALRYQRFSGQLREKKTFTDSTLIRNRAAVEFLQQRGILDGNDDGSFNPQGAINRAESLKVLLEALGEVVDEEGASVFSDVPRSAWYAGYVGRARALGIVKGYGDGTFRPGQTVNQVELLKIAFESFGIALSDYPVTSLPDGIDPNAWYAVYLQYALDNDLLDEEKVNPSTGMTRELFSEVIYRLIQQQENLE